MEVNTLKYNNFNDFYNCCDVFYIYLIHSDIIVNFAFIFNY